MWVLITVLSVEVVAAEEGKGAVVCEGGRVLRCGEGRRQRSISAPSLAWTGLMKVKGGRPQAL